MVHRWRLLLWLLVSAVQFLDYLLLTASWNIYYYGPALSVSACQSCQAFWRQVLVGAGAWYSVLGSFTGYRFPILKGPSSITFPSHRQSSTKIEVFAALLSQLKSQNAERMPMDQRVPWNNAALKVIVCQLLDSRDATKTETKNWNRNRNPKRPWPSGSAWPGSLSSFGPIIGSQLVSIYQIVSVWQSASQSLPIIARSVKLFNSRLSQLPMLPLAPLKK